MVHHRLSGSYSGLRQDPSLDITLLAEHSHPKLFDRLSPAFRSRCDFHHQSCDLVVVASRTCNPAPANTAEGFSLDPFMHDP